MKEEKIESIEKEIDFLSKEFRILEENYNNKDYEKFNDSKKIMFRIQKKILGLLK